MIMENVIVGTIVYLFFPTSYCGVLIFTVANPLLPPSPPLVLPLPIPLLRELSLPQLLSLSSSPSASFPQRLLQPLP